MPNKIVVNASRNGSTILVNYDLVGDDGGVINRGTMGVDLLHTDAMDYSTSPPTPMTQEQRIDFAVNQVVENLQRLLKIKEAGELDGDLVVNKLQGMILE